MSPDDPQFETLPRKEQALILFRDFNWSRESLEEEYEVAHTTIKRWLDPEYARKQRERSAQWEQGHGRARRQEIKRKSDARRRAVQRQAMKEAA